MKQRRKFQEWKWRQGEQAESEEDWTIKTSDMVYCRSPALAHFFFISHSTYTCFFLFLVEVLSLFCISGQGNGRQVEEMAHSLFY
jgi:hypothetical protein